MFGICLRSPRFPAATVALVLCAAAFVSQTMAAESSSRITDLSGQWGRDMLFFEPPASGAGPVINSVRKTVGRYEGDTLVIDTVDSRCFRHPPQRGPACHRTLPPDRWRSRCRGPAQERCHRPNPPYGRGTIDPDTAKKGLYVEFIVEDLGMFTATWFGSVTYRRRRCVAGSILRRTSTVLGHGYDDTQGANARFLSK
jgi:hypothetical protein